VVRAAGNLLRPLSEATIKEAQLFHIASPGERSGT
jgi:hypothetical protein